MPVLTETAGSPINGGVSIVVPGRILLLPAPAGDLPEGTHWADDGGPSRRRRFSAAFYAELLRDMGVTVLIGLDGARCGPAPAAAHSCCAGG